MKVYENILILIIALIICIGGYAQNERWILDFIAHHPTKPVNDTSWFGLDTAGGWGYQTGIDSIDTLGFQPPVAILAYDSVVKEEFNIANCINLRKDIKGFKNGTIKFHFYVLSDTSTSDEGIVKITWDKDNLIYSNKDYAITYIQLQSINGFINGIDNYHTFLYDNRDTINYPDWINPADTAILISENPSFECNSNERIIKLNLVIGINDWLSTSVIDNSFPNRLSVYPNPTNQGIYVKFSKRFSGTIHLYNTLGQIVAQKNLDYALKETILLKNKGTYYLQIFNSKHRKIATKVISKI